MPIGASTPNPPAFDRTHIAAQWGAPPDEIYFAVLEIFTEEAKTLCIEARASLSAGNRAVLARAAHTLVGAAANVGALHLARCAEAVEASAESGERQTLEPLLQAVETAWRAVQAEVIKGVTRAHG